MATKWLLGISLPARPASELFRVFEPTVIGSALSQGWALLCGLQYVSGRQSYFGTKLKLALGAVSFGKIGVVVLPCKRCCKITLGFSLLWIFLYLSPGVPAEAWSPLLFKNALGPWFVCCCVLFFQVQVSLCLQAAFTDGMRSSCAT